MTMEEREPGYELIDAFYEEFVKRTGLHIPEFGLGQKSVAHYGPVPRICFVDTGGDLSMENAALVGGSEGDIAADDTVWTIHIWADSREQAIELFYELIRAMRDVVIDGNNLLFEGEYELHPSSETARSRLLTKTGVRIRTGVPERTTYDFTLVTVEKFETEVSAPTTEIPIIQTA